MRGQAIALAAALVVLGAVGVVGAHMESEKLPAGPIRDRHELMEGIGKNSKIIGDAVKSGKVDGVAEAAEKIQASAAKIPGLFPKDSTDPKSRAKPEIWAKWAQFEAIAKRLDATAGELATAAKSGGDVPAAAKSMFGTCKTCHDDFRKPEKKKGER
jgi:cytochrome c556